MAATLAQIIGVEQGVRSSTETWWRLVRDALQNENMLYGIDKVYEPEPGNLPQSPQRQRVQANTQLLIAEARAKLTRYFDVTASKDWGNMGSEGARADVTLNGHVILADAPATFLLFLEKRLGELAADLRKIPAQSLAEDWQPSTEPGIWRTPQEKRPTPHKVTTWEQIVPPTPEHPAEVREVSKDVVAGTWTTVKYTSAPTAAWRAAILDRIAALREAVQSAIYDANKIEAEDKHIAGPIFSWIFDGTLNGTEARS
jgi:hypothetical protein